MTPTTTMGGASVLPTDRPLTAGDDWIEWHGGENPVPGQCVEIRERSGRKGFVFSEHVIWSNPSGVRPSRDIIAYRLARPATSAASEGEGDRIGTHGPDCWGWGHRHYECALREIDRLAALASPPSERERELERALKLSSDLHAAYERLIYGLPKYLESQNLTDEENMIREAYITLDVTAHRLADLTAQPAGEPTHG